MPTPNRAVIRLAPVGPTHVEIVGSFGCVSLDLDDEQVKLWFTRGHRAIERQGSNPVVIKSAVIDGQTGRFRHNLLTGGTSEVR